MPDKEKPEEIRAEVDKKTALLSKASLLVLVGVIVSAVAFLSNLGQMCDSHTIGWRVKFVCDWIAEPKITPDLQEPILPGPKPSPSLPKPNPPPSENNDSDNSDRRFAALEAAAKKWRFRTGPIHESLADLLGSITAYDQNQFANQPVAQKAWDYLQSIQKIISSETDKIRSQDKNAIPINVDVTGLGDIGDRAAKRLADWLKSHRFNTNENGSLIYVTVRGRQESHPNDYTSLKDANTSLWINAEWLDGSLFFESKIGPVPASAGSDIDAENHSFDDAVNKMISVFQSHVD